MNISVTKIRQLVESTNTPTKLAALALVVGLIAFLTWISVPKQCSIDIIAPLERKIVGSSLTIHGSSKSCLNSGTQYTVALLDSHGAYYSQGNINIPQAGAWSAVLYLGPAWSGTQLIAKVIGYPRSTEWGDGDSTLPNGTEVYDQVILNAK